jgi:hypothetical protein
MRTGDDARPTAFSVWRFLLMYSKGNNSIGSAPTGPSKSWSWKEI